MKNIGVHETTDSAEYNISIIFSWKKDGSKRLVVDLRIINALIKLQLVSLPIVSKILQDILSCKPKYLNFRDLRAGFF